MTRMKWIVLWSLWAASLVRQPTAPIRVSGGWVRGVVARDGSHIRYFGLPYATVERRFQAPGPEPTWEGIFDAVNENVRCPQRFVRSLVLGQENCLTLNVYTPPDVSSEEPLPVMVYFHGGGFYEGSGTSFIYGPDYFISKRVILVTTNYRFNIQGFVCLGIKEAPGNAGMKDQVAALRWVQRNIAAFGGDPDNVTIFGESAGAASVSYHILSPMSKGLFHKAILQSGSSLASWAYQFRPVYMASLLAKHMGHITENPHELFFIFMNKTDEELILTRVPRKEGNIILSELLYVPCTEQIINGVESFLTDVPYDILVNGDYNKVPMIIGSNYEEGYTFADMENNTVLEKISFEKSLPKNLIFPTEHVRVDIANMLSKLYMGEEKISKESVLKLSKLHGEPHFNYPAQEETSIIIKTNNNPVYNYVFKYDGWRNIVKILTGHPIRTAPGAAHADDIFYLFSQTVIPTLFENKMINRMTTLWTNFAKHGNPTPEVTELIPIKWPRVDQSSPQSLMIDDELSTIPLWHSESLRFWRDVYSKYRRKY